MATHDTNEPANLKQTGDLWTGPVAGGVPLPVDVVLLPSLLTPAAVAGRVVVVFDVLRATTTMTAALAAGASEIALYPTIDAARAGHAADPGPKVLAGERECLKPEGFDFGNSPGQFTAPAGANATPPPPSVAGARLHMATTNGTKALLAPAALGDPLAVLAGALVNRLAVARACVEIVRAAAGGERPAGVTLLCAGTNGEVAYEDVLGCGAVLESLVNLKALGPVNDAGLMAMGAWTWSAAGIVRAKPGEPAYPAGFRLARGAAQVIRTGLAADVAFAARPDVFEAVGELSGTTLRARRGPGSPG